MKVRELRFAFSAVADLSADEIKSLSDLLEAADELSVTELCAATTIKLPKAKRAPVAAQINEDAIAEYVAELRDLRGDDQMKATFVRLKKDKRIKLGEARAIARQLLGERIFKTKAEAMKAIEKRQIADARATHRRSHIEDIF
ncbi:MAG: hypothetical protein WC807_11650 [Hyphomicrobium sp.]|jgi:hypothetical protein